MLKNLRRKSEGFTIIEVLIVLAIAGLILLIVFLAVPALNRTSRNNSYRNEAAQLLSAASEFSANNNGNVPVPTNNTAIRDLTKNKSITNLIIVTGPGTSTPTFDTAVLRTGAKCGTITGANSHDTGSASTRSLALIYAVENSAGNVVAQCQES